MQTKKIKNGDMRETLRWRKGTGKRLKCRAMEGKQTEREKKNKCRNRGKKEREATEGEGR